MGDQEPDIPARKLAKVGANKERKKGGVPLLAGSGGRVSGLFGMGGGGVSAGSSGWGGAGLSGLLGGFGGKVLIIFAVAALGVGAYGVSEFFSSRATFDSDRIKPFSIDKSAGGGTGSSSSSRAVLGGGGRTGSVGYVSESLDGKTPEQRAAEAAAKAAAEKEAQARADGDGAKSGSRGGAGLDPAALAAAAGSVVARGRDPLSGKALGQLGQFNKDMGASWAGGALSGGVGQGFQSALRAPKVKGGGSGSNTGGFARSNAVGRSAARAVRARGGGNTLAGKQLRKAFGHSMAARGGPLEQGSAQATNAFENAPAANSVIGGAGTKIGGAGTSSGGGGLAQGSQGGGAGAGGGSSDPNSQPSEAGYGPAGQEGPAEELPGAPPVKAKDKTPWKNLLDIASKLLLAAGLLLSIAALIGKTQWGKQIALYLAWAAAALAGIATIMGMMIIGMGATSQGLILTVTAGILTAVAVYTALSGDEKPSQDAINDPTKTKPPPGADGTKVAQTGADSGRIPPNEQTAGLPDSTAAPDNTASIVDQNGFPEGFEPPPSNAVEGSQLAMEPGRAATSWNGTNFYPGQIRPGDGMMWTGQRWAPVEYFNGHAYAMPAPGPLGPVAPSPPNAPPRPFTP
ncbi:MAG: hypothetical protein HY921_09280 [Elusimicrobia bacterium]|nr:hypothetical protein [Elusimicrobiota bacterium]